MRRARVIVLGGALAAALALVPAARTIWNNNDAGATACKRTGIEEDTSGNAPGSWFPRDAAWDRVAYFSQQPYYSANPTLHAAQTKTEVVVKVDPAECSFQFNPVGTAKFTSGCDVAKAALARSSVMYRTEPHAPGFAATVTVAGKEMKVADASFAKDLAAAVTAAGYPTASDAHIVRASHFFDVFDGQKLTLILILTILVVYVTMVYGPIAAALVEMFPARIRYTSMSLPYHLGNGWLGGFLPTTAFAMVAATGNIYYGLWYPIAVAAFTAVVGLVFLKEMNGSNLEA